MAAEHRDAGPTHGDAGPIRAGDGGPTRDAFVAVTDSGVHVDAGPLVTCVGAAATCAALHDRAHAYAMMNPMRDGATWDGWSTSLVFRFGAFTRSANTANDARAASTMLGADASRAPIGAFHWWSVGTTGIVGVDLSGGGTSVFMASSHVMETWGTAIGTNGVAAYTSAVGARYLGWSMDYLGQRIDTP